MHDIYRLSSEVRHEHPIPLYNRVEEPEGSGKKAKHPLTARISIALRDTPEKTYKARIEIYNGSEDALVEREYPLDFSEISHEDGKPVFRLHDQDQIYLEGVTENLFADARAELAAKKKKPSNGTNPNTTLLDKVL